MPVLEEAFNWQSIIKNFVEQNFLFGNGAVKREWSIYFYSVDQLF
jgi:hypothetical protein